MNLKQTLLIAALEHNGGNTVFIPFPANEKKEGDKSKLEKLLPNSQGLIRIFLISFCLILFSFQGLHGQSYTLNNTLNGTTQTTCSGTFYDSGGSGANYASNQNYTVTFCSSNGKNLQLDFTAFDLEPTYDILYIYNGSSTVAAQVAGSPFSGSNSPGTVVANSTCLTVKFTSDNSTNKAGWAANISCQDANNSCACTGNLLENNGFEAGNMNYWTVNALAYYDFYTGNDNCGTKSVRLKKLVGLGLINPVISQQENNIEASKTYTLSFDAGTHDPSYMHRMYLRFYNAGGSLLSENYLEVNHDIDLNSQLQSYSFSSVAPANTSYLKVEAVMDGDWLKLDNLCLVQSSCSSPILDFHDPVLVAGTASSVGAKYKFSNVIPGVDAYTTITAKSHSDVDIFMMDEPAINYGGYDQAFQPHIDYNWINGGGNYDPAGEKSITFQFDFVDAATGLPKKMERINMTGLDIDGSTDEVREFVQSSGFQAYEVQSPSSLTLSGALKAKGDLATEMGIVETALHAMISFVFENKSSITVIYGGDWNGSTGGFGDSGPGNSDEKRLNSLYFKCYDFNAPSVCPTVSISGASPVCAGASVTLQASVGGNVGTCSLQWQSSTDNATWTNIGGATGNSYTTPAATATKYYRAVYSCTGAALCGTLISNVETVALSSAPPSPQVTVGDGGCAAAGVGMTISNATGFFTQVDGSAMAWQQSVYNNLAPGKHQVCLSIPGCSTCVDIYTGPLALGASISSNDSSCQPNDGTIEPGNNITLTAAVTGGVSTYFKLNAVHSGKCLEVSGNTVGTNMLQNSCSTAASQNWIFIKTTTGTAVSTLTDGRYYFQNVNSKQYLYPEGGTGAAGANAEQNSLQTLASQWDVTSLGSGQYKITNALSGMALTVTAGDSGSGKPVSVAAYTAAAHQKFSLLATNGLSYSWDNSLGTLASVTASPAATKVYTVTVTDLLGCTKTSSFTVAVVANSCNENCTNGIDDDGDGLTDCTDPECSNSLSVNLGADLAICAGNSITMTASATGGAGTYTYTWSNSLGTGSSKTVSPAATTTYGVTVSDLNGCTASDNIVVTVKAAVDVNPGGDQNICGGNSTTLMASATGGTTPYTFAWSNGLGSGASKTVSPSATTSYTVTVTAANGCTDTGSLAINVNEKPGANAGTDFTVCQGESVNLLATASGTGPFTYSWDQGLGVGSFKTVSPTATTNYTVTIAGGNGCTQSDQVTVFIKENPVANAGSDITLCKNFNTLLSATATGGTAPFTYLWDNSLGLGQSHTVMPLVTTMYSVTITSANGCVGTDTKLVTVQNCVEDCSNGLDDDGDGLADCADLDCGPMPNAGTDISICPGTQATLSVGVSGGNGNLTYSWSHGLGTGAVKTVTPATTTTYSVTVTAQSGCTGVDQVKVTVVPCSENCTNGVDDDGDGLVDCADPDCSGVTAPVLADDSYSTCPGMPYSERVSYNDDNLQNPAYSIYTQASNGTVTIDNTGKFFYMPNNLDCTTDVFVYEVCNQNTGCCSQATVTLVLGDNTDPVLTNVPADVTIGCDDAMPQVPLISGYDECPGLSIDYAEVSNQHFVGACESYTVTRTWTATDLCGNAVSKTQNIQVSDQTKPEIFQVYSLDNGTKMIAGVAKRVTQDWKYVPYPVTFTQTPIVFTQVITNNDPAAVVPRQKNATTQGFELSLREEELSDNTHDGENVAWVAIEPGIQSSGFKFEAGTLANINQVLQTLNFSQSFSGEPIFLSSILTHKENDPATLRHSDLSATGINVALQEEQSKDTEINHTSENMGYLAIAPGSILKDKKGDVFGETGKLNLTHAWATVNLTRSYSKPVVLVGGLSWKNNDPLTVRVRNVTNNKFEIHLQEWDYLDGDHPIETVNWIVVEGSIPGNLSYYCAGNANDLQPGINVFAVDNCDNMVAFGFTETSASTFNGELTTRTWMAVDDCGNTTLISRYDTCSVAALKVKTKLYGAMVGVSNSDLMRDNLRQSNILPIEEPYSELPAFPYVVDQTPGGVGDMITICHNAGTTQAQTLLVSRSALEAHLAHGDRLGSCDEPSGDYVTICHKPGTPTQKTKTIPVSSLQAHLQHGDILGACDGNVNLPPGAATANYRTIADGLWSDEATWLGGNIPTANNINSKTVSIEHNVVLQNSNIVLKNNSTLWLTTASLKLENGDFVLEKGRAEFLGATYESTGTSKFLINHTQGVLTMSDCVVNVGANFENNGGKRTLDHVCLNVGGSLLNSGLDSLMNSCAIIGGNLNNSTGSNFHADNSKFKIVNGNFQNSLLASFTGDSLIILVENGSLLNLGAWLADVDLYCVSNLITVPVINLLFPEECSNILNYFNPCSCDEEDDDDNLVPTGGGTGQVDAIVLGGEGGGVIDPQMLQNTGDTALVDWVLVELRDPLDSTDVLAYATVPLRRDGSVVSESGASVLKFPGLTEGYYFVALRHRNHIGAMTANPVFISSNNPPLLDFTNPAFALKGGNGAMRIIGGKRFLWAGDLNEDGKAVYQGPYNDVFFLFSRVLSAEGNPDHLANFIVHDYAIEDLNLDGKVIYQGPNNDKATLLYHSVLAHPFNTGLLANYIVKGFIP